MLKPSASDYDAIVAGSGAFVHRDASLLVKGINAGGSSTLNFATAADSPAAMFAAHGIDLAAEVRALRAELPIGAKWSARDFIDQACTLGAPRGIRRRRHWQRACDARVGYRCAQQRFL